MPFDKMKQYAAYEGYCCPWALLTSRKRWWTSKMVEDSGMTSRAIRYWRRAERRKTIKCVECKGCLLAKILADRKGPLR